MATSQRPRRRTASRCVQETDRCTHVFEIPGYSLHKGISTGEFIESATFAVGGHDWRIVYYPNGDHGEYEGQFEGYVSVFLELLSKTTDSEMRALFDFRLVDPATGVSSVQYSGYELFVDDLAPIWGTATFMKKSEMEASFLRDDSIVIECDVTVIMGKPVSESKALCEIPVPPSDLLDNLGNLLESGEGADVAFKVEGEVFHAHKVVLAMRSHVFKVEFYGPMRRKQMKTNVTVEEMQPAVFKALLHFIYKDSFPAMDDLGKDEYEEMVKHLLVAADRYAMERMKVMCESILEASC